MEEKERAPPVGWQEVRGRGRAGRRGGQSTPPRYDRIETGRCRTGGRGGGRGGGVCAGGGEGNGTGGGGVSGGARPPRQRGERAQVPDELLVEVQGVGLVEEKGRPEGGAEGPEEDEAGHQPDLSLSE